MKFVEPIRDRKKISQIKNLLRGQGRYRAGHEAIDSDEDQINFLRSWVHKITPQSLESAGGGILIRGFSGLADSNRKPHGAESEVSDPANLNCAITRDMIYKRNWIPAIWIKSNNKHVSQYSE